MAALLDPDDDTTIPLYWTVAYTVLTYKNNVLFPETEIYIKEKSHKHSLDMFISLNSS
jgi:hypothetical protein